MFWNLYNGDSCFNRVQNKCTFWQQGFRWAPLPGGQHSSVCATSWSGGVALELLHEGVRRQQPCTALVGANCQAATAPAPVPHGCLALRAGTSLFRAQTRRACPGQGGTWVGKGDAVTVPEATRSISHGWTSRPSPSLLFPAAYSVFPSYGKGMVCLDAHSPSSAAWQNWPQCLYICIASCSTVALGSGYPPLFS